MTAHEGKYCSLSFFRQKHLSDEKKHAGACSSCLVPSGMAKEEQPLSRAMECPVCLAEYVRPLLLNCGHTICAQCTRKLIENENPGLHIPRIANAVAEEPEWPEIEAQNVPGDGAGGHPIPPVNPPPVIDMVGQPAVPVPHHMGNIDRVQYVPHAPMMHQRQNLFRMERMGPMAMHPPFQGIPYPPHVRMHPMGPPQPMRECRRQPVLKCPECRTPCTMPAGGFPVNYKLQELMERLRQKPTPTSIGCACAQCDTAIEGYVYFECLTCDNMTICSMCGMRNHHEHNVKEQRVLSEEEVMEAKKSVIVKGSEAQQRSMDISNINHNAQQYRCRITEAVDQSLRHFELLHQELHSDDKFTSHAAQKRIDKAELILKLITKTYEKFVDLERRTGSIYGQLADTFEQELQDILDERMTMKYEEPELDAVDDKEVAFCSPTKDRERLQKNQMLERAKRRRIQKQKLMKQEVEEAIPMDEETRSETGSDGEADAADPNLPGTSGTQRQNVYDMHMMNKRPRREELVMGGRPQWVAMPPGHVVYDEDNDELAGHQRIVEMPVVDPYGRVVSYHNIRPWPRAANDVVVMPDGQQVVGFIVHNRA